MFIASALRTFLLHVSMLWICVLTVVGFAESAIAAPSLPTIATDLSEIHWSYLDDTGPTHWAELDKTFAICASGKAQSPINLTAAEGEDLANPEFHYEPVPLNLLNNGHTVQVPYAPGSYITLDGVKYNLLQFHFHSPSEHAIDNQAQAAELHLVHQNEAGELAVVAVMMHTDDEALGMNDAYKTLTQHLPLKAGDKVRSKETINAQTLLPARTTTYRYSGSLTTPPCSESVTWLVMTEPVTLSKAQSLQYKSILNHNNRPLQLLNQRAIQVDISQ